MRKVPYPVFLCLLFFLCSAVFAQKTLKDLEEMWHEGNYAQVIPRLIDYSIEEVPLGERLRIDYMLGTSMCRVAEYQNDGASLLEMIPFVYRHISEYNYKLILKEKDNCKNANRTIAHLSFEPPGVIGKGGIEMISEEARQMSEEEFIKKLEEYNGRLFPVEKGSSRKMNEMRELAGDGYKLITSTHFIVVGASSGNELRKKAELLETILSRFMNQFEMQAPTYFITVYLLRNSQEMVRFAKEHHDINLPATMWGYTFPYDWSIVLNAAGGMGTVGHEIFHSLLNHNFRESPPWLNEGFSALFEEFTWDNQRMIGTYRNDHWRIQYLHKDPENRPSLAELLAMDWRAFDASYLVSEKREGDGSLDSFEHPPNVTAEENAANIFAGGGTGSASGLEHDLHVNHTTAKFFAMYLQNKRKQLEDVYHAFQKGDFRKDDLGIVEKYQRLLEATLDNMPIEDIEKDFQLWLANDLQITN